MTWHAIQKFCCKGSDEIMLLKLWQSGLSLTNSVFLPCLYSTCYSSYQASWYNIKAIDLYSGGAETRFSIDVFCGFSIVSDHV
jgi:hypothetical protein